MILVILLLAFILRLPGITQSLWLDEAAQAVMSSAPLSAVWRVDGDFHPPLFHLFLHFWMQLSQSEWWMRLLSVLFGVAAVYLTYRLTMLIFKDKKMAFLSAFLLAVSPYHIWYSQELRSYSLATFLTVLATLFLVKKKWRAYALVNVFGFFANYIYVFSIFSQFTYLAIFENKQLKKILLAQIPLLIAFSFWWPEFTRQLNSGAVLNQVHPEWRNLSSPNFLIAIPLTFAKFIFGRVDFERNIFEVALIGIMLLTVLWIIFRLLKLRDKRNNLVLMNFGVPIILAWFISFCVPLNGPWRLILFLPFLIIAISSYIISFKDKHLIYIFLAISIFGIFMQNYVPKNRKEDWRAAVKFIQSAAQEEYIGSRSPIGVEDRLRGNDKPKEMLVVFEFIAPFAPWLWYEKSGIDAVGAVPAKANEVDLEKVLRPKLTGKKNVYLFEYFADVTDPNRLVRKYLEARHFKVINFYEFNNLGFVYKFWQPSLK